MRLVHFLQSGKNRDGDPLERIFNLARSLAERGHEVGLVSLDEGIGRPLRDRLDDMESFCRLGVLRLDLKTASLPREMLSLFPALGEVRSFLSGADPDIVHAYGNGSTLDMIRHWLRAGKHKNQRLVYSPVPGCRSAAARRWSFLHPDKKSWQRADGIIFDSQETRNACQEYFPAANCPATVIHHGLSEEDFAPRQIIDMASDFFFLGEIDKEQSLDALVQALARMKKDYKTGALIAGSGPYEKELRRQVERYGLSHEIFFNTPLKARTAFLKGGCLVLPGKIYSIPLVVLQAAAAGVPIIASDSGGMKELIGEVKMPLVPPGDTNALQRQMVEYLTAPQGFLARAAALRQHVEKHFALPRMVDEVEAFYANRP